MMYKDLEVLRILTNEEGIGEEKRGQLNRERYSLVNVNFQELDKETHQDALLTTTKQLP
jgi:hypothetical protein